MPGPARRTLATRLAAAVVALGSAIVLAGALLSYRTASTALRQRLLLQLEADATTGGNRLTDWLLRQRDAVTVMAAAYSQAPTALPSRPDSAPLDTLPRDLLATEEVQLIAVPGGRVLRATNTRTVGTYAVDELYYREGREAPYIQSIYYNGETGRPRLTISTPIRTKGDSTVRAVLAAHLDLSLMEEAVGKQYFEPIVGATPPPIEAYLVNRDADFVSAHRFGRLGVRRGVHSEAIDNARQGGTGTALYTNHAGVAVIGSWRWIPQLQLALIVEAPQEEAFAPARTLLINSLILGLLGCFVLALGVIAITRRFTEPVVSVANAATRVDRATSA